MHARRWTPDQEQAIAAREAEVLVSAAAGAGKTAVLTERVLRQVLDPERPVDVDRFLVVTFTEAAAEEMRARLAGALFAAASEPARAAAARRQIILLGQAPISTLHAFCLRLLRRYFHRLDLDPAFRVLGEHEALLLRHDVLDQILEEAYRQARPAFLELLERYARPRDDSGLRRLVLDLHEFSRSLPDPGGWLAAAAGRFGEPRPWPESAHFAVLRRAARYALQRGLADLQQAKRWAEAPGGPSAYLDVLAGDIARFQAAEQALAGGSWPEIEEALRAAGAFARLPPAGGADVDPARREAVRALRDAAREAAGEARRRLLRDPGVIEREHASLAGPMNELAALVRRFDAAYGQAKRLQNGLDFADLEHLTLGLLGYPGEPSDVACQVAGELAEILVDEYQDINAVQDAILSRLARCGPRLFLVGDVKQSIYRFRQAEPRLFLEKYETFAGEAGAARRRIDLRQNFRSRRPIIAAVNELFRPLMRAEVAELDYDGRAALVYGASYPDLPASATDRAAGTAAAGSPGGFPVELHILATPGAGAGAGGDAPAGEGAPERDAGGTEAGDLDGPGGRGGSGAIDQPGAGAGNSGGEGGAARPGDADDLGDGSGAPLDEDDRSADEREADWLAGRIRELVEQRYPVWDDQIQAYRPARFRDIAVLLRATRSRASVYRDRLAQHGLPVHATASSGYLDAREVRVVLALLRLLDNPRQDIPLAAVLRSPFVGLTVEELARIRLAAPRAGFYDAVLAAAGVPRRRPAPDVPPRLAGRLAEFLRNLQRWRTLARRGPLYDLLYALYEETGYVHHVRGLPGGEQRRANLYALLERAREFDGFARHGLGQFLRFLERLEEQDEDFAPAPALGEGEDVVRILSIHKSKGLEFPIVFVAGLGHGLPVAPRSGSGRRAPSPVLCHRELGLGPEFLDPVWRHTWPSAMRLAVAEAVRAEALAEELRVLYVALTRARERLVLSGGVRNLPAAAVRWATWAAGGLPPCRLEAARSYLDWLAPALMLGSAGRPLWEAARQAGFAAAPAAAAAAADGQADGQPASAGRPGAGSAGGAPGGRPVTPQADDRRQDHGPSAWRVQLWDAGSHAPVPLAGQPPVAGALAERVASESPASLVERLRWRSPWLAAAALPAKRTVSDLKNRPDPARREREADEGEIVPAAQAAPASPRLALVRPRFLQAAGNDVPSAAERGTATHVVLRHLDLTRPCDEADIAQQLAGLVERELLLPEEAGWVDVAALGRFFASPLGRRLRSCWPRVRREVPFSLSLPAHEVYGARAGGPAAGEAVLVQGVVDCLAELPGGEFLLLDFKTDRLPGGPQGGEARDGDSQGSDAQDRDSQRSDRKGGGSQGRDARDGNPPDGDSQGGGSQREDSQGGDSQHGQAGALARLAARYEGQIRLYARAVEAIWQRPVREAYLYFLQAGAAVEVPRGAPVAATEAPGGAAGAIAGAPGNAPGAAGQASRGAGRVTG